MPPSLPERYNGVMAKRFLTSLRLVNLSSDPASASSGDIYYNSSTQAIKLYNGSSWSAVGSGGGGGGVSPVESASAYPASSSNGTLLYNTSNQRVAIYFDSVWKEFAYLTDVNIDGGNSYTADFASYIDGGSASTTSFFNPYDGGSA